MKYFLTNKRWVLFKHPSKYRDKWTYQVQQILSDKKYVGYYPLIGVDGVVITKDVQNNTVQKAIPAKKQPKEQKEEWEQLKFIF